MVIINRNILSFLIVVSVMLDSARFGLEGINTTIIIGIPFSLYIIFIERDLHYLYSSNIFLISIFLSLLLTFAFFSGHANLKADESLLSLGTIFAIPTMFFAFIIIFYKKSYISGIIFGLALGIFLSDLSIFFINNSVEMDEYIRRAGIFYDPNFFVLYTVPSFFLLLSLISTRKISFFFSFSIFLLSLLTIVCILFTTSKAAIIIVASSTALYLISSKFKLKVLLFFLFLSILLYYSIQEIELFNDLYSQFVYRFLYESANEDIVSSRSKLLELSSLFDILIHPFGIGYQAGLSNQDFYPHNTFFDYLLVTGPIGLILYLLLFYFPIKFSISKKFRVFLSKNNLYNYFLLVIFSTLLVLNTLSVLPYKIVWFYLAYLNFYYKSKEYF